MPRAPRFAPAGYVYHALQRAVARLPRFEEYGDFAAFQRVMALAQARCPIPLFGRDGALTAFLFRLTHTPTQRWHAHHKTAGTGQLY